MPLQLYNTLTRRKEPFVPIDPKNVRMYVCGPTVYDYAHIGNARPIIVFDVLFRLLRHIYGPGHVTYARNITDVDDKINARAARDFPSLALNDAIAKVTAETTAQFHKDIAALGVIEPTVEPRATGHIEEMKAMCEALVANGHAYVAADHVLFDVASMPDYGKLSNRSLEEMEAGARVEVAPYKKGPMDFVLWKPSKAEEPGWPSPCGIAVKGRPGWHIECSAMSGKHLGEVFDIHGGGIDLAFPHHENEIAQSRCAHGTPVMANVWMHNGFLQVEGEKMSKSLGNFITIHDVLLHDVLLAHVPALVPLGNEEGETPAPADWQIAWNGLCARLSMLQTKYREPLDWTEKRFNESSDELYRWYEALRSIGFDCTLQRDVPQGIVGALCDDLNSWQALTELRAAYKNQDIVALGAGMGFLGLLNPIFVERSDILLFDRSGGLDDETTRKVESLIAARLEARKAKNWAESDRIRDELAAMGIQLKDSKNPATGEIETTWEVKR